MVTLGTPLKFHVTSKLCSLSWGIFLYCKSLWRRRHEIWQAVGINVHCAFGFSLVRIVGLGLYSHYFTVYVQTQPVWSSDLRCHGTGQVPRCTWKDRKKITCRWLLDSFVVSYRCRWNIVVVKSTWRISIFPTIGWRQKNYYKFSMQRLQWRIF